MLRIDGRQPEQLRPIHFCRGFTGASPGSVLVEFGRTKVLCTASVEEQVPPFLVGLNKGWVTAEYSMLPGSTNPRKSRERQGRTDGRAAEIQRLIGRSLRAVTALEALGPRIVCIDCDVLEADGGTRTAAITGGWVALVDAVASIRSQLPEPTISPIKQSVAAISVGLVEGNFLLDLSQQEDSQAKVDLNVVMGGDGRLVEIQGTGEEATFTEEELAEMLRLARRGIAQLTELQRQVLGADWPIGL